MKKAEEVNTRDKLFILCVAAAALLLRLIALDSSSLTLNESENALSALNLFGGSSTGQLLYALPTALLFKMFGDTDFTARLFPALMGALAVFIPLSLCKRYGRRRMYALAFLVAADPVLLFWSKRADAVIPALALTGAAFAFFMNGRKKAALACLFIALCGGARCLPALIVLLLGSVILSLAEKTGLPKPGFGKNDIAASALITLLFITACTAYPAGFASFGTGIAGSLRISPDWTRPGLSAVLMAAVVYCGIPLLLCFSAWFGNGQFVLMAVSFAGSVLLLLWQGIMAFPWISVLLLTGSLDRIVEYYEVMRGRFSFGFCAAAGSVIGGFSFIYFRAVEVFNQTNGYDPVQITWNGTNQVLPLTRIGASVLLLLGGLLIVSLIVKILLGFSDAAPIRSGLLFGCAVICSWGLVTNIWNTGGFDRIGDYPAASHLQNSFTPLGGDYTAYKDSSAFDIIGETAAKYGDQSRQNFGLNYASDPLLDWKLRKETGILKTGAVPSDIQEICLILDRSGTSFSEYGFVGTVIADRFSVDWEKYGILDWGKWLLFGDGVSSEKPPLYIWVKANYILSGEETAD